MAVTANWKVTWQCRFTLYGHIIRVIQLGPSAVDVAITAMHPTK